MAVTLFPLLGTHTRRQTIGRCGFPDAWRYRWTTCTFDELVKPSHHAARADRRLVVFPFEGKMCTSCLAISPWRSDGLADNPTCAPNRNDDRVLLLTTLPIELAQPRGLCRFSVRILAPVQGTFLPSQTHRLGGACAPDVKSICAARANVRLQARRTSPLETSLCLSL